MQDESERLERWHGKVALVTGASAGIGHAVALALAGIGMRVAITARRAERLETLRNELTAHGAEVLAVAADLATPQGPGEVFARVRETWGGVDVLVNNAGLGHRVPVSEADWEHLQPLLDLNVRAATLCMQEALRDMQGKQDAAIINVSSVAGHRVPPGHGATFYAATKHALKAITDGLRMELVRKHSPVKIGMLSPGMVESEFHDVATPGGRAGGYEFPPLKAEDIADALLYMLSVPRRVQIHDIVLRSVHQPH
ncbi:MAG TPA: SDR family NAD(P)-dependent oxidoreductase [bacterium]|nr:SDR family NAD(P)-dependent oxidoreductase [bacterium]